MQREAEQLEETLRNQPLETLVEALQQEVSGQYTLLLEGIMRYREFSYQRDVVDPPCLWSQGNTRLLDFSVSAAPQKPTLLLVPSLINRAYILDLDSKRSFARYLATHYGRVQVIDWGDPGEDEKHFGCAEYIARLGEAIETIVEKTGQPVILAGYCMGGMLALAASLHAPQHIHALALLATPWDFHAEGTLHIAFAPHHIALFERYVGYGEQLPKDTIRQWFYLLQANSVHKKFQVFATLEGTSEKALDFVAIQRWIDDGVAINRRVVEECCIDWAYHNTPQQGEWHISGKKIVPEALGKPCLIAIPQHDRIVPPACSAPLAGSLPQASVIRPDTGHIGMMAGRYAEKELWVPFVGWLGEINGKIST